MNEGPEDRRRLGSVVRQVTARWRALVDRRLEPLDLSNAQWRPLAALYCAAEPMTQAALAKELGIEAPTLVRLLDRLAAKGFIVRQRCPGDRRAHHVQLTPQALAICEQMEDIVARVHEEVTAPLSPAEQSACVDMLSRVIAQLETLEAVSKVPARAPAKSSARRDDVSG